MFTPDRENIQSRRCQRHSGAAAPVAAELAGFCFLPNRKEFPVRIVDIREIVVPIKSDIRNAYIDFSQMTVSVLALVTDVMREGKPVIGYGFNSNGRYAPSGLLRD